MKHTTATILTVTLTVGALTACTQQPEPTPTISTATAAETTTAPTPTETLTPTEAPTPTEPSLGTDQVAAQEVVSEFFRLLDELRQDPGLALQPLADVTTGETQRIFLDDVVRFREDGVIQIGDTSWEFLSVAAVTEVDGEMSTLVEVCTDSADADIVDQETGESILPADRGTLTLWTIETVTENDRWKVGDATSVPTEECS
ncbi:hypothetical protein GCM10028820_31560 [Tessaracoccus terricola]